MVAVILAVFAAAGFTGWASCDWKLRQTRRRLDATLDRAADLQRRLDWEAQRDQTLGARRSK